MRLLLQLFFSQSSRAGSGLEKEGIGPADAGVSRGGPSPFAEGEPYPWPRVPERGRESALLARTLSPEQVRAATTLARFALVEAGPGSGKTLTLVYRVAYMLQALGVSPQEVVLITFTRKAAEEMRSRLRVLVGDQADEVEVGTFHAYGLRLLQRAGVERTLVDEAETLRLYEETAKELDLPPSPQDLPRIVAEIQRLKGLNRPLPGRLGLLESAYQELKRVRGLMDYEDLITLPSEVPDVLAYARPHAVVDEFQDVNWGQLHLLKTLAATVYAVGDPKQAIYGWRGADWRIIRSFADHFPGAARYVLTANFRSATEIVHAGNRFLQGLLTDFSPEPQRPTRQEKGSVAKVATASLEEDVRQAVALLEEILEQHPPSSVAVLYRSKTVKGGKEGRFPLERALHAAVSEAGIPVGGMSLDRYEEYRFFLALMEDILFPSEGTRKRLASAGKLPYDILEALRGGKWPEEAYTERGKSLLLLRRLLQEAVDDLSMLAPAFSGSEGVADALSVGRSRSNAIGVAETLSKLYAEAVREGKENLLDFLDFLWERAPGVRAEGVSLMTVHAAKGLEWPVVLVVGVRDGVFPSSNAPFAEESLLFYVALTRAKDSLYLLGNPGSPFLRRI